METNHCRLSKYVSAWDLQMSVVLLCVHNINLKVQMSRRDARASCTAWQCVHPSVVSQYNIHRRGGALHSSVLYTHQAGTSAAIAGRPAAPGCSPCCPPSPQFLDKTCTQSALPHSKTPEVGVDHAAAVPGGGRDTWLPLQDVGRDVEKPRPHLTA